MKGCFLKTALILTLFTFFPAVLHAEESKSDFQSIQYCRILPHAFIDQAKESIPKLHPNFEILFEQRSSVMADVTYSLIVYREDESADIIHIEGAVVKYPNAWLFNLIRPKGKVIEGVVSTMEQIASLKN